MSDQIGKDQTPSVAELEPDMQAVRMKDIDQPYYSVNYHMLPTEVVERLTALQVRTPGGLGELYQVDDLALLNLTMARIQMLEEGSDKRIELQGLVDFINQTHDVIRFTEYLRRFGKSRGYFPEEFEIPQGDANDPERVRELIAQHYPDGFTPGNLIRMVRSVHDLSRNRIPKSIQVTEQFSALVSGLEHSTTAILKHVYVLVNKEREILNDAYNIQLSEMDSLWLETIGGDEDIREAISGSMRFFIGVKGKGTGEA